jgi:hypothetical protein
MKEPADQREMRGDHLTVILTSLKRGRDRANVDATSHSKDPKNRPGGARELRHHRRSRHPDGIAGL